MKNFWLTIILMIYSTCYAQLENLNPDPNGNPWINGAGPTITPEYLQTLEEIPEFQRQSFDSPSEFKNNYLTGFMPVVWGQIHGECGPAAGVYYCFSYEINRLRMLQADENDHYYPTHFTYNFLKRGSASSGTNLSSVWNILKDNGCPSVLSYECES